MSVREIVGGLLAIVLTASAGSGAEGAADDRVPELAAGATTTGTVEIPAIALDAVAAVAATQSIPPSRWKSVRAPSAR